jgi:pilus assembly protein CpaF
MSRPDIVLIKRRGSRGTGNVLQLSFGSGSPAGELLGLGDSDALALGVADPALELGEGGELACWPEQAARASAATTTNAPALTASESSGLRAAIRDYDAAVTTDATGDQATPELLHEFRELIAVIVGHCDRMAGGANDPAGLEADLVAIRIAVEHALTLTEMILRPAGGYGPLEPLLHDRSVSVIMVNGPDEVFIERRGVLTKSEVRFDDEDQFVDTIRRMVAATGQQIDALNPIVDGSLPDGSRVNAIIRPASTHGPALTIRKITDSILGMNDLVREGSLSPAMAEFLRAAILGRANILISGEPRSGKTTTLKVLAQFIAKSQRVITIEDATELRIDHPNVVSLESRPPNRDGNGKLPIRQLLDNSSRMRPDRILVGEVRGAEVFDVVQAMNRYEGSMSTIEAKSARDATSRLETMVLMASIDLPLEAIRAQIASGLNLIVHQANMPDGSRKIVQIAEVVGYDSNGAILRDIFLIGVGPDLRLEYNATGYVPTTLDKAAFYGVQVDQALFDPEKSRFVPAGSDIMRPVGKPAGGQSRDMTENPVRQVVVVPFSSDRPALATTPEMQEEMRKLIDAARSAVDELKKANKPASQPPPKRTKPPNAVN